MAGFAAEAVLRTLASNPRSKPNLLPGQGRLPLAGVLRLTTTFRRRVQCRRAVSV